MTQRYSISEFEDLWQKDPERYGCVTVKQAIASLEIDEDTLSLLIQKGGLERFEIGDDARVERMISLKSLMTFKMAKATRSHGRPARILELLTEAARKKQTLAYGDVMQAVGLTYKDALHRQRFVSDLREATEQSELYKEGLLIGALLVSKIQHLPTDEFFLMAKESGMFTPGKDSKTVLFKEHIGRIFQYYDET